MPSERGFRISIAARLSGALLCHYRLIEIEHPVGQTLRHWNARNHPG